MTRSRSTKPENHRTWYEYFAKSKNRSKVTLSQWLGAALDDSLADRHPDYEREDIFKAYLHCCHAFIDRYVNPGPNQVCVTHVVGLAAMALTDKDNTQSFVLHDNVTVVLNNITGSSTCTYPVAIAFDGSDNPKRIPLTFLAMEMYLDNKLIGDMVLEMAPAIWNRSLGYRVWKKKWLEWRESNGPKRANEGDTEEEVWEQISDVHHKEDDTGSEPGEWGSDRTD